MSKLKAARDPRANPGELERLAKGKNDRVKAAVAANPNTPLSALGGLLSTHAGDVLSNPALALHLLARPDALYPLDHARLAGLAQHTTKLGEVLGWGDGPWPELRLTLAYYQEVQQRLTWLPQASGPHELHRVRTYLLQRGRLSEAARTRLLEHERHPEVLAAFVQIIKEGWQLERFLDEPRMHERMLMNPAFPAAYLEAFVEHPDPMVRRRLPEHPDVSAEQLIRLARDESPEVRAAVARHPSLPEAAARRLRYDTRRSVYKPLWPDEG